MPGREVIQLAQQCQVHPEHSINLGGQPASFVVLDNQQARPSRPLTFTPTLTERFNPLSVPTATGEEISHNISALSSFFGNLESVMSYRQINTQQPFSLIDMHQQAASPPTTTTHQNISSSHPRLSLSSSQPTTSQDHPNLQKNNYSAGCLKKIPKQEALHTKHITPPNTKK